jgi:hypothetical protein
MRQDETEAPAGAAADAAPGAIPGAPADAAPGAVVIAFPLRAAAPEDDAPEDDAPQDDADDGESPLFLPLTRSGSLRPRRPARPGIRPRTTRSLTRRDIARMVQRRALEAGILVCGARSGSGNPHDDDDTEAAAHALRRGIARGLWERNVPANTIMTLGRWRSETEMRAYVGLPLCDGGAGALLPPMDPPMDPPMG